METSENLTEEVHVVWKAGNVWMDYWLLTRKGGQLQI